MNNQKIIYKISLISIIMNTFLSLFKFIAGIIGNSQAMISDSIHSISDVFTTIIVIIGTKISNKEADDKHPYGHERFECVISTILSIVLFITGVYIGYKGLETIIITNYHINKLSSLALVAATISIIVKEIMYYYTIKYADLINSLSLRADAKHHRSDSLSSIGSLIGIFGSKLGFPISDSIASIVICLFIIKTAFDIFRDSMNQMIDRSCDTNTLNMYRNDIKSINGVINIDLIKTRLFGSKVYVDIEISVDAKLSIVEAHNIAENAHKLLESKYRQIKHCAVTINPHIEQS